jgi:hypothetical protein
MTVLQELHARMKARKPALGSLTEFQRECEEALASATAEAGFLRLFADMAGRFIDRYDRSPLPYDVATTAYGKLLELTKRAATATRAEDKLALFNEIARTDLG